MALDFNAMQTLCVAILVLFLGRAVIARVPFLSENNIPIPVVGGIIFALLTTIAYLSFNGQLTFDMALQEPMMLAFFTTIGLNADLRLLVKGGSQLLVFGIACLGYLIVQDGLGIFAAMTMDLHPLVGLLSSSITLSGGHGTGAAYAQNFAEVQNIAGAMELAMACATFGLIIGGLLGGPVAGKLIRRYDLEAGVKHYDHHSSEEYRKEKEQPIDSGHFLWALLIILICLIVGASLYELFSGASFTLPKFIWCLFVGVVLRNLDLMIPRIAVHQPTVTMIGTISLSVFLAMALMSLRLWELLSLAGPLLVMLLLQAIGMVAFATFVTFRIMGANYDAAVIAGGHCGFGMGATPTAVANMEAVTRRYGPSAPAFLVVPLMGAFFIDILNALVIQAYLSIPVFGF
jgi:ESS family glutamate:Na+ symporter